MTTTIRLLSGAALLMAIALCSAAKADPALIAREKAEIQAQCPGPVKYGPKFVTKVDINGDGAPDYLFDYSATGCTAFCGSGGCSLSIYVSRTGGMTKAFDETVQGWSIAKRAGRALLVLNLHGSACNRPGYQTCKKSFGWNGSKFVLAR